MSIVLLRDSDGLDALWDELTYTEARLGAKAITRDLAAIVSALIDRTDQAKANQKAAWRAETLAQAQVDEVDDSLDDEVTEFSLDLARAEQGNKQSHRYRFYFAESMSLVIRLGLENELKTVAPWAKSLAGEPEAALKAHGLALEGLVTEGQAAVAARTDAARKRAEQHLREIRTLFDDVNAARVSLAGELDKRGVANKKPKDWSLRFFRRAHRTPKAAAASSTEAARLSTVLASDALADFITTNREEEQS